MPGCEIVGVKRGDKFVSKMVQVIDGILEQGHASLGHQGKKVMMD